MLVNLKKISIEKAFFTIFIISLGVSSATFINGYIEYKLFSLPKENIRKTKNFKDKKMQSYSYLDYLFEKDFFVKKKNEPTKNNIVSSSQNLQGIYLLGTVLMGKSKLAFLKVGNKTILVRENENVKDFKVKNIGKYFVILERGKNIYKLVLKVSSSGMRKKFYTYDRKNSNENNVYILDRKFVEKQTSNIGNLLKNVLISPVIKNGKTVGFRFKYVSPKSIIYKYGIRSGDLILSVNGRPVRTVEEAFKIYNILRNEKVVNVEIERNGKRRTIVYKIY